MSKDLVSGDGLVVLEPFGFNNTYTLALDESIAEEHDIHSFSDFSEISKDFTLGAVFEFIDRPDGLPGFKEEYNIDFKKVKEWNNGRINVALGKEEEEELNY